MNTNCRASIIIPVLNEEDFLEECINSLLNTAKEYLDKNLVEIIIIDNGSNDNTRNIAFKYTGSYENIHLIDEPLEGVGYARRTGARYAITRSLLRSKSHYSDFWIISTDADVTFPCDWINNYFYEFDKKNSLFLGGNWQFSQEFDNSFPNSNKVFTYLNKQISFLENIFNVINLEGNNSAIERSCYAAIGPYEQPTIYKSDRKVNLPGEDWDMSTRAVIQNLYPLRLENSTITRSARRVEVDLHGYFSGTAYEIEFKKVDKKTNTNTTDISLTEILTYLKIATHRKLMHFVGKPILANPDLLNKKVVVDFLGEELVYGMKLWLKRNPKPDMFLDRENFILNYLLLFHESFSQRVLENMNLK